MKFESTGRFVPHFCGNGSFPEFPSSFYGHVNNNAVLLQGIINEDIEEHYRVDKNINNKPFRIWMFVFLNSQQDHEENIQI